MSHKSISSRFFDTYGNQHDVEGCAAFFSPEAVIHLSGMPYDLDFNAYKQMGYAFLTAFPDMTTEIHDQIEEDNKVVTRLVWRGTHQGELLGMAPTGKTTEVAVIAIDRIEQDGIAERWVNTDLFGMMQQLGMIPPQG